MPTTALREAYRHCLRVTRRHYENFPVASLFLPAAQRRALAAVYAFSRQADDYADEPLAALLGAHFKPAPGQSETQIRLQLLEEWEGFLDRPRTQPVFLALEDSIQRFQLPRQLFHDLLSAFRQDVVLRRYPDFAAVLDYCRRSANPVGRLVLHLFGRPEDRALAQSDAICTALQLANFWQDLGNDLRVRDRLYLPLDECESQGVRLDDLRAGRFTPELAGLMRFQVERTRGLFDQGRGLPATQPWLLRWQLRLTLAGGRRILDKIQAHGFNTLDWRPKLSWSDAPALLLDSLHAA